MVVVVMSEVPQGAGGGSGGGAPCEFIHQLEVEAIGRVVVEMGGGGGGRWRLGGIMAGWDWRLPTFELAYKRRRVVIKNNIIIICG